jgi:hypothetical protein
MQTNLLSCLVTNAKMVSVTLRLRLSKYNFPFFHANCLPTPLHPFADYCQVCFHAQHRKGTRKRHTVKRLITVKKTATSPSKASKESKPADLSAAAANTAVQGETLDTEEILNDHELILDESDRVRWGLTGTDAAAKVGSEVKAGDWFLERSKYIPLRLTLEERKFLRLLEAALNVSEYTDKIDIISYTSKSKRQVTQIKELCAIISGLVLAADYKTGQALFRDRNFEDNEEFFQDICE